MTPPPAEEDVPRDKTGYELFLALRRPGCPICRLTAQAVTRHLETTSYDNATDIETRAVLRATQGWCAGHAQQWLGQHDALGTALDLQRYPGQCAADAPGDGGAPGLYGETGRIADPPARAQRRHPSGSPIAEALEPQGGCPACAIAREAQRIYVGTFAGALTSGAFLAAYRQHPSGICLPHLRAVLPAIPDAALVETLVEAHAALLERISADLAEVIRKHDYRFRDEPRGAEFDAVAQAVEQAAGTLPNPNDAG